MICQQYFKDEQAKDPTFTFAAVVVGKDNEQCRAPQISALVAKFSLYGNLIGGILTAISSPKLGAMSDRYGRLKIIAITTCGMFVGEVITIIAATWPNLFSVNWLLVGAATDGICGSFIAAMAVAHAYASDCTAPSKRAVTFGYFHGCLFGGIAVGPLISGYIIKATGTIITPFYIALCAHLIFISLLLFVLPESLTKERQLENREKVRVAKEAARLKRWNVHAVFQHVITGGGLFKPLQILWPTGAGSSRALRRNLFTLAAVDTIMFGVAMGSMSIVIIYSIFKFGWGTMEQSIFSSISSACRVGVLLLLLPLIGRIFRGKASMQVPTKNTGSDRLDLSIIHVAILFDLLGYVGYAVAMSGDMLMAAGALASVGGMGSPTLQSALTKHVPADRTGQLLGAMGLLHALAKVVAPTIFSLIYTKTVEGPVPQTVFICLAATFGLALLLSLFIRPHSKLFLPPTATPRSTANTRQYTTKNRLHRPSSWTRPLTKKSSSDDPPSHPFPTCIRSTPF
jgi:MFS family permease